MFPGIETVKEVKVKIYLTEISFKRILYDEQKKNILREKMHLLLHL